MRAQSFHLRAGLSLLCATIFACSNTSTDETDAGADDFGVDASSVDARVDDASTMDASARDATTDASIGPDPHCEQSGCVRSAFHVGDYLRGTLIPYLDDGVTIDNGYSVWTIEYVTRETTSLATVAIPYPATPPETGYAIVANAHGTIGLDDACTLSGTVYGSGLAGLFGARGAIGVATDYPGLGTDGVHPYLVSDVEGAAVLDSIRATAALAEYLGVATSGRSAVVGVSQGGHATIAAAALRATYAPDLDVRAFAAAAPASVWLEHWQGGLAVEGSHLTYHALLTYAWASHYGYTGPALWNSTFGTNVDSIMADDCIFDFGGIRTAYADVVPTQASDIFSAGYVTAFASGFTDPEYAMFANAFATNRLSPYTQTAPLSIWQGDADSVVLKEGTDALVEALRAGGVVVDYEIVPMAEHTEVAFGYVAQNQLRTVESIAWVFDRLSD